MRALRAAFLMWLVIVPLAMWLPTTSIAGFDRVVPMVRIGVLLAGAVLLALADGPKPRFSRRLVSQENLLGFARGYGRPLVRIAALLAFYAAVLGLRRYVYPDPRFRPGPLPIGWILPACAATYAMARIMLISVRRGTLAEERLERLGAAFRCEAEYSGKLRDLIQVAYSICVNPSMTAEDKIERVRHFLDQALGAELPKPDEDVLDSVFGPRGTRSARHRPPADDAAPPN